MDDKSQQLSTIIQRESSRLARYIRRRIANIADAEDILQDVFAELTSAYQISTPIDQFGAWLTRVAQNRIIDRYRKKTEIPFSSVGDDEAVGYWLEEALPAIDQDPESEYLRNATIEAIYVALEELPDNQRMVFIAHEFEGLKMEEIAQDAGVSINTVLSWKRRAIAHLRIRLEDAIDTIIE